jgi:hypothetical protein
MMTSTAAQPAFPTLRAVAALSAAAGLLLAAALGGAALFQPGAADVRQAVWFAAAVGWASALAGLAPVVIAGRRGLMWTVYGYFVGMGLRLALCFGASMVAVHGGWLPGRPTALALAVFYLPLLLVEVGMVGRYLWQKDLPGAQGRPGA